MKYYYLFLFTMLSFSFTQAQIVDIPDANFKDYLVNSICVDLDDDGYVESDVDTNNDGEIQVSEAEAVFFLEVNQDCLATSVTGIEEFVNLIKLKCSNTLVENLDLSFLSTITEIEISNNNFLSELNLGELTTVDRNFICQNNSSLENLNLINLTSVGRSFYFDNNNSILNLDLNNLHTVNNFLNITNNLTATPFIINLSRLTNVNQTINISINNLESINLDSLTTIHGFLFRSNFTVTDLNLGSVISNSYYSTSSDYIEISSPDLVNINLENLQSSVQRIIIDNQGNTMNVNLNSLTSVPYSNIALQYDSEIINLPNLIEVDFITIAGDIQEVNLESLETGNVTVNTLNDDLNSINLDSLTSADQIILNRNHLTSLDLNNLISVGTLWAQDNQLSSIGLNSLESANLIVLSNNQLNDFELSNVNINQYLNLANNPLANLYFNNLSVSSLTFSNSEFYVLDLSNVSLENLDVFNNSNFYYLDIKNGTSLNNIDFNNVPNLIYICADNDEIDIINDQLEMSGVLGCQVNDYCSFVPGGSYYTIEGSVIFDIDNNGCGMSDPFISNVKFNVTDGTVNGTIIPNASGDYSISVQEGIHNVSPILESPDYFAITPESISVDFPLETSPYIQNYCITPNGIYNDLEIVIIPMVEARPGFDTEYKIIYSNKGTTTLSGNLEFSYNENAGLMEFVSSVPTVDSNIDNVLTWSFTDLMLFETREILVTMSLNTPTDTPPLNGGDDLGYVVDIFPLLSDQTPRDNNFQLKQTVVNSFDPNDKTCLQGETIEPEDVGKYVHYLIRFENTGTASAENIVVKDEIDMTKYDVSTLIPLNSSHDFVTRIKDDNIVEFIFEDINLPFDDANNDGYVLFKIKTLETLELGDTFSNDAEIYFDYNAPIITNDELTTVAENLSVEETELQNLITIYPNPATDVINLESRTNLETITVYDVHGRQIFTQLKSTKRTQLHVSQLSKGVYFLKIKTTDGEQTTKFIKK